MEVQRLAIAGTLESSGIQVVVEPFAGRIQLPIESDVMNQYGRQIKVTVLEALGHPGVKNGKITVNNKSALECTLKACVECMVFHSCGTSEENIPRGGAIG